MLGLPLSVTASALDCLRAVQYLFLYCLVQVPVNSAETPRNLKVWQQRRHLLTLGSKKLRPACGSSRTASLYFNRAISKLAAGTISVEVKSTRETAPHLKASQIHEYKYEDPTAPALQEKPSELKAGPARLFPP